MATCRQARHRSRQRTGRVRDAGTYGAWPGTRLGHWQAALAVVSRLGPRCGGAARRELARESGGARRAVGVSVSVLVSFPTIPIVQAWKARAPAERVGIAADTALQLESGRHERCTCGPSGRYEPRHELYSRGSCRTVISVGAKAPRRKVSVWVPVLGH